MRLAAGSCGLWAVGCGLAGALVDARAMAGARGALVAVEVEVMVEVAEKPRSPTTTTTTTTIPLLLLPGLHTQSSATIGGDGIRQVCSGAAILAAVFEILMIVFLLGDNFSRSLSTQ